MTSDRPGPETCAHAAVADELAETRMQLRLAEERAKALAERLVEAGVTD